MQKVGNAERYCRSFKTNNLFRRYEIMKPKRLSRRDFLRMGAGAGGGLLASGLGAKVFAQDATATPTPAPTNTPAPLPVGEAGKLTVIHKTEYFAEVQNLFREDVVAWAAE